MSDRLMSAREPPMGGIGLPPDRLASTSRAKVEEGRMGARDNTRPGALDRALTIHYRIHARRNCHMGSRVGWLRDRRAGSCNVARRSRCQARWIALSPYSIGFMQQAPATWVTVYDC